MSPPSTGVPESDKYRDWSRRPSKKNARYRSRVQVVADILYVIIDYVETDRRIIFERTGIPTASLMYGASLNFNQMKRHTQDLVHYHLIEKDKISNTWEIKPKGREFLKSYEHLKSLLPVIETGLT